MCTWNDVWLAEWAEKHGLVTPYDEACINPASIDLKLGRKFRRPHPIWEYLTAGEIFDLQEGGIPTAAFLDFTNDYTAIDFPWQEIMAQPGKNNLKKLPKWGIEQEMGVGDTPEYILLHPGEFVLCHSIEFVKLPLDAKAVLFSKSSTGRVGLEHLHAGLGDPGWEGEWAFEFHNVAPWMLELAYGARVMQMSIERLVAPVAVSYSKKGRYQNQTGATISRNTQVA